MVNLLYISKCDLPDKLGKDIVADVVSDFVNGCFSALMNSFSTFISILSIESSSLTLRISGGNRRWRHNHRR